MKKFAVIALVLVGISALAVAQRQQGFGGGFRGGPTNIKCLVPGTRRNAVFDTSEPRKFERAEFVYARLKYNVLPHPGDVPWHHDYPDGDTMLPDAIQRLTSILTNPEAYQIVEIDGKELFKYPFVYMSEVGYLDLRPKDVKNLREYLDRGGFVLVDDFRGKPGQMEEMENFVTELRKLYPDRSLEPIPANHQIFHSFFDIDPATVQAPYDMGNSGSVQFLGLKDEKGRLQFMVDFNNDASEFWQGLDVQSCTLGASSTAIQLGINYVVYAMTH